MKSYLVALCLLLALALTLAGCGAPREAEESVPQPTAEATAAPSPAAVQTPAPTVTPIPSAAPVELLLQRMTTEEKLAQLLLFCCHDTSEAETAAAHSPGGICLYADAFAGKGADEVRAMTAALQEASSLPLLLAVDEEGGSVCRVSSEKLLRNTPFPSPRALIAQGGLALVESDAEEKSRLLLDLGLNVNLAPVADVPLDKSNYIFDRCASTDPAETADYVSSVVSVMRREGVGAVLKHFPGYGGSADTHQGAARDERPMIAFTEGSFLPFIAGIEAGAEAVLVSHNIVVCMDAEHPASLSWPVHRILREKLDFSGVILSDDLGMAAVGGETGPEPVVEAFLAGNDLLCCSDYEAALKALQEAFDAEQIGLPRLNASVERILRWKASLGLLPGEALS